MINTTVGEIVSSVSSLNEVGQAVLSPAASMHIAKLNKIIKPILLKYNKDINESFKKRADGKEQIINENDMQLFEMDKEELEAEEVNIDIELMAHDCLDGAKQYCYNHLLWILE